MTCAFCNSHGFMLCQWPVEKLIVTTYGKLAVGDRIKRYPSSRDRDKKPATVDAIGIPRDRMMPTSFSIVKAGGGIKSFAAFRTWEVLVARPGLCGNACCSEHRREVGEDKAYCREHWRAWELVA